MTLYDQRLKRTLDAVAMKPVDKIPFSYSGPAYLAREQGVSIKDYTTDFPKATDAAIGFVNAHPGIDSIQTPIISPHSLSTLWLSRVRTPGNELPDDELWQVDEQEVIKFEDYEKIIEKGYAPWVMELMQDRLDNPLAKMQSFIEYTPACNKRLAEAGMPVLNGANAGSPFEGFCGGRTLMNFFVDLMQEPELIKKVFDNAQEFLMGNYLSQLDAGAPIGAWVGGWRAAPELLSHDIWMEFVWPYLKPFIIETVNRGVVPILHFDSNWESELETLKELPAGKCILMLDGTTDMRKARAVLDERMCLMGDVPASMLAFGSETQVYDYVTKLIDDVGPKTGLIVSSGCDNPLNAKPGNVNAMIQATVDYRV